MPTEAVRRGDLSVSTLPIYDPFTGDNNSAGRTAFANNQIPQDRFDQTARAALAPAAAQPAQRRRLHAGDQQLFRPGAVHPQPAHAGHQGELERVRQAELLRPLQRARFRHRERHQFRQGASGAAARQQQSWPGRRQHLQLLGREHLHAVANDGDGCARRIRAHEFGVAQSDLAEFKGRDVLGLPGTNGPNFYEGARRSSTWIRTPISAPRTRSCRISAATISCRRCSTPAGRRAATTSGSAPTSTTRRSTTRSPRSAAATVSGRAAGSGSSPDRHSSRAAPTAISTTPSPRSCSVPRTGSGAWDSPSPIRHATGSTASTCAISGSRPRRSPSRWARGGNTSRCRTAPTAVSSATTSTRT